jgi:hypothetical protein
LTSCLMALHLRKPPTPPDFLNLELLIYNCHKLKIVKLVVSLS